ncbi:hypothetical protein EXIGLDRAFT_754379 [Exidia glandulosa HHB12029]|uniref:Uncharacterized protein n=1 Tax=Exidia glandulosa HHB12029 TaxID=1314781 RepID=A0A165CYR5_EXIGL|nr:hypothetical protein EXIGLDRAFT_754379 [Exidia glandulosa HHB12029]
MSDLEFTLMTGWTVRHDDIPKLLQHLEVEQEDGDTEEDSYIQYTEAAAKPLWEAAKFEGPLAGPLSLGCKTKDGIEWRCLAVVTHFSSPDDVLETASEGYKKADGTSFDLFPDNPQVQEFKASTLALVFKGNVSFGSKKDGNLVLIEWMTFKDPRVEEEERWDNPDCEYV